MVMYLAECSYEDAIKYRGRLVTVPNEEGEKPINVLLNIVTDNPDEVLSNGVGIAKCVTTKVKPTVCPEKMKGNVFYEVAYEDFNGVDELPDGVVVLVRLPEDFCDMRKAEEICLGNEAYDDVDAKVRLVGGNLLEISTVAIGRYNEGKEKMSAVFNGVYDIFKEVKLSDLEVKQISAKKSGNGNSSPKKPSNSSKKAKVLGKIFSGNVEF